MDLRESIMKIILNTLPTLLLSSRWIILYLLNWDFIYSSMLTLCWFLFLIWIACQIYAEAPHGRQRQREQALHCLMNIASTQASTQAPRGFGFYHLLSRIFTRLIHAPSSWQFNGSVKLPYAAGVAPKLGRRLVNFFNLLIKSYKLIQFSSRSQASTCSLFLNAFGCVIVLVAPGPKRSKPLAAIVPHQGSSTLHGLIANGRLAIYFFFFPYHTTATHSCACARSLMERRHA